MLIFIMENCIFCKIVRGEIPAEKIWENENFVAFLDVRPVSEGHTLVIPKKHFENLFVLSDEVSQEYIFVLKEVGKLIIKKYNADGFNISLNNGKSAGQVINHIHFHILPRKINDGKRGIYTG